MFYFSETSKKHLRTCCPELQALANEVIKTFDCSVVCGHRDKKAQNEAYENGLSEVQYPNSKHNKTPSEAMDLVPYFPESGPTWQERQAYYFAGYVMAIAKGMGLNIRSGADWNMNNNTEDQSLKDPCHFEVIEP